MKGSGPGLAIIELCQIGRAAIVMGSSETASIILLLTRWRSLVAEDTPHRVKELRINAQRCRRLAESIAGLELAEELEAIGRDFEREARDLSARMQAVAYQICFPGLTHRKEPTSTIFQQLANSRLV
jgi:hypothetical protein